MSGKTLAGSFVQSRTKIDNRYGPANTNSPPGNANRGTFDIFVRKGAHIDRECGLHSCSVTDVGARHVAVGGNIHGTRCPDETSGHRGCHCFVFTGVSSNHRNRLASIGCAHLRIDGGARVDKGLGGTVEEAHRNGPGNTSPKTHATGNHKPLNIFAGCRLNYHAVGGSRGEGRPRNIGFHAGATTASKGRNVGTATNESLGVFGEVGDSNRDTNTRGTDTHASGT